MKIKMPIKNGLIRAYHLISCCVPLTDTLGLVPYPLWYYGNTRGATGCVPRQCTCGLSVMGSYASPQQISGWTHTVPLLYPSVTFFTGEHEKNINILFQNALFNFGIQSKIIVVVKQYRGSYVPSSVLEVQSKWDHLSTWGTGGVQYGPTH